MSKDKILDKLERKLAALDYMYCLHGDRKALEVQNYYHERDGADLYVACKLSGQLEEWRYYPRDFLAFGGLAPDRKAIISGRTVYFEVERSEKRTGYLEEKIAKYCALSEDARFRGRRFNVIVTTKNLSKAEAYVDITAKFRRGNQFVIALQEEAAENVLADVFVSPRAPEERLTLAQL